MRALRNSKTKKWSLGIEILGEMYIFREILFFI